ncbi:MAG: 4Fe-4S binding protein [Bacteriovoracaceae bacterium]|nr:4Fe-4S binding protein [Bacteriovoracaceae bacterium]
MIEIDQTKCIGCIVCTKVCPHQVLAMKNHKAEIINPDKCIECDACGLNCSSNAIKVTKGTGCFWLIVKQDILKRPGSCC